LPLFLRVRTKAAHRRGGSVPGCRPSARQVSLFAVITHTSSRPAANRRSHGILATRVRISLRARVRKAQIPRSDFGEAGQVIGGTLKIGDQFHRAGANRGAEAYAARAKDAAPYLTISYPATAYPHRSSSRTPQRAARPRPLPGVERNCCARLEATGPDPNRASQVRRAGPWTPAGLVAPLGRPT
jgi:hypothetical protein